MFCFFSRCLGNNRSHGKITREFNAREDGQYTTALEITKQQTLRR